MIYNKNDALELINRNQYDNELFDLKNKEGSELLGVIIKNIKIIDFFKYKAVYNSIVDVDSKIKKSLSIVTNLIYEDETTEYNIYKPMTDEEFEILYYLENAIYRITIEWDLLAQLYDVKFKIVKNVGKINYYKYFTRQCKKVDNVDDIENLNNIIEHIQPTVKNGTHKAVNEYRKKMTHRITPSINTVSDFGIHWRENPMLILGYTIRDYCKLSHFVKAFLENLNVDELKQETFKLLP